VLQHAVALFDTASALVGDSANFVSLVAVGKARALLGLDSLAAAAAAVAAVPDDYRYIVVSDSGNFFSGGNWDYVVADHEGENGLDYRTSGDPRSVVTVAGNYFVNQVPFPAYFPAKYAMDGLSPIVLASGIEARLIEAEAALRAGNVTTWLTTLNHLRQTAWPSIVPAIDAPLPDLTDPGTDSARVSLLFRERALWLFLTGHRQGDLRRLIRQYGRGQEEVYPIGPGLPRRPSGTIFDYGTDVTFPIPGAERVSNPLFHGCISRQA